jgi:hypothetical protein
MSIFIYATLITVQNDLHCSVCTIVHTSKTIFCLSDSFIGPSYAITGQHDLLQEFVSCVWFLLVDHAHASYAVQETVRGCEIWYSHRPGLWTNMSVRYKIVIFAGGKIKCVVDQ